MMMTDLSLPSVIRAARKQRGLTQHQIASQLGISEPTYRRVERGDSALHIPQLRVLARMLKLAPSALGLADDVPPIGGDDFLRMVWALFTAGRNDTLRPLLPSLLVFLGDQRQRPTDLMVQGYHVAMTLLRDQGNLDLAQVVGNQAVVVSADLPSIDNYASALFGRSRVAVDSAAATSDVHMRVRLLDQAHRDADHAAALADRCRPIIRAILLMNQGEIIARAGGSAKAAWAALDQAVALAGRYAGTDESGHVLHPSGVLHIRARVGLYGAGTLDDAEDDILNALELLPGPQHRWRADMLVTFAAIQSRQGDPDAALGTATSVIDSIRQMDSTRIRNRLHDVLLSVPTTREQRALVRKLNRKN